MSATSERFPDGGAPDPYVEWDAAYLLGALSPEERLEFEGHLAGCGRCRSAVAEIAGLPGLMAQVGPEDAARLTEAPDLAERVPDTVLPEVLATVRRERGRGSRRLLGLAAAVALLVGGAGLGQLVERVLTADEPQQLPFVAVEPNDITANVSLVPTGSGTEVRVECQYAVGDPGRYQHYVHYALVVVDRDGQPSQIGDWPVKGGRVMRPSGTTPLKVSQIRDVQIRELDTGATLLEARPR